MSFLKIQFAPSLYVCDGLKERKMELCEKFLRNDFTEVVYLIYKNQDTGKPEFISSVFLMQKYFETHPIYVIGMVKKYEEALQYLADYVSSSYDKEGNEIFVD